MNLSQSALFYCFSTSKDHTTKILWIRISFSSSFFDLLFSLSPFFFLQFSCSQACVCYPVIFSFKLVNGLDAISCCSQTQVRSVPQTPAHDTCLLGQDEGSDESKHSLQKIGCRQSPSFPSSFSPQDCNCCFLNYGCLRAWCLCRWLDKHFTLIWCHAGWEEHLHYCDFYQSVARHTSPNLGSYIIEWLWLLYGAISSFKGFSHNGDLKLK